MKIMVIGDNESRCAELQEQLERAGMTSTACRIARALSAARQEKYDAIIVDFSTVNSESQQIVKSLRAIGLMTPLLCIGRDNAESIETVYQAGADEYIASQLAEVELVARIKNVSRRPKALSGLKVSLGNATVDSRLRMIFCGERNMQLSELECLIISYLFANSKQTYTAEQLFEKLWTEKEGSSQATVRVHINSLRKKLFEIGAGNIIRTVRGRGYMAYA